ncbi:MAG TPA: hypothetical protein DCE11_07370 [Ruminiclostridium sp.]|nr:hypothetical protein [Ruminiclostridium sp.]
MCIREWGWFIMDIIKKSPEKYGLMKVGKNVVRIVRLLREYDNIKEASDDLARLLVGETTEDQLVSGQAGGGEIGSKL